MVIDLGGLAVVVDLGALAVAVGSSRTSFIPGLADLALSINAPSYENRLLWGKMLYYNKVMSHTHPCTSVPHHIWIPSFLPTPLG